MLSTVVARRRQGGVEGSPNDIIFVIIRWHFDKELLELLKVILNITYVISGQKLLQSA